MAFMSDTLLIFAALFVAVYCAVLSRRLKRLSNIDGEVGQSIARLSQQLDALKESTRIAAETGQRSVQHMHQETDKAQAAARHLELLIASLHTLPASSQTASTPNPFRANAKFEETVVK